MLNSIVQMQTDICKWYMNKNRSIIQELKQVNNTRVKTGQ